jgi:hypothetical protein
VGRPAPEAIGRCTGEPSPDALDPSSFAQRLTAADLEIEAPVTP